MVTFREKERLRGIHKQLKVGILHWDDVDPNDKILLIQYYGWNYDGGWN
jgi:hypothetical protein